MGLVLGCKRGEKPLRTEQGAAKDCKRGELEAKEVESPICKLWIYSINFVVFSFKNYCMYISECKQFNNTWIINFCFVYFCCMYITLYCSIEFVSYSSCLFFFCVFVNFSNAELIYMIQLNLSLLIIVDYKF